VTTDVAIGLFRETLLSALVLAAPMLIAGLLVGLAVSIFQAATQIHEMTVSFVPKILVVAFVLILFLPWMARYILEFSANLFGNLNGYGR
jgi:flagellar biosynthetic protein FliQ